jgi:hypothetical protein
MRIKPFKRIIFNSIAMRHFLIVASLLFLTSSLLVAAPGEETSEPGKLEASTEVSNLETGSEAAAPLPPAQFPTKGPDEWRFHLVPMYIWAMGISGEGTIGDRNQSIDADFGDLFDSLEFIFTVHFEAGKGRWGGFFDYSYIDLNSDVRELPMDTVNVDLLMKLVEGGATIGLAKGFEALAGFRYVSTDIDTRFGQGPQFNMNESWADPIFGIRYVTDQSKRVSFVGRFDLGGYSTSKSSDFTWNVAALVDVKLKSWISLIGGYRALSFDYKTKVAPGTGVPPVLPFRFDAIMQGPVFALGFHF